MEYKTMCMTYYLTIIYIIIFASGIANSHVFELTQENYDELTQTGAWFVDFYAPVSIYYYIVLYYIIVCAALTLHPIPYNQWCQHCKALDPIIEEVAEDTHTKSNINIGKVDCTSHKGNFTGIFYYPLNVRVTLFPCSAYRTAATSRYKRLSNIDIVCLFTANAFN